MTIQSMVRVLAVGASLLAVACGGGTPPAQDAAPAADQAQAAGGATVRGDLIKDWERQKESLMGIADAMPEGGVRLPIDAGPAQLRRAGPARRDGQRQAAATGWRQHGTTLLRGRQPDDEGGDAGGAGRVV